MKMISSDALIMYEKNILTQNKVEKKTKKQVRRKLRLVYQDKNVLSH